MSDGDLMVFRNVWVLRLREGPHKGEVPKHLSVLAGDEMRPVAARVGTLTFDTLAQLGRPEPVPPGLGVDVVELS